MKDFNNQIKSAGRRAGSRSADSAGRGSSGMGTLEGFGEERKPRAPRTRRSYGSEEGSEERAAVRARSPRTRRSYGSEEGREERAARAPRTRRNFSQEEGREERKPRAPRTRRPFGSEERGGERKSMAPRSRRSYGSEEGREERAAVIARAPRTRRSYGSEEGREERAARAPRTRRTFGSEERGGERKSMAPRSRRSYGSEEGREERTARAPRTRRNFSQEEGREERKPRTPRTKAAPKAETTPKAAAAPKSDDGLVRLNKYIANSGVCSRREADEYITAGLVTVNGTTVTELGTKVSYSDDIRFNGERLRGEEKVYIVMNKPKDFVTTVSDPHAENTVVQLVANKCKERVYPVGRLDKSTTGVLLLTNDGELAEQLTHPSYQKKKIYQVTLDRNLKGNDLASLMEGITLEDGPIAADDLQYTGDDKSVVGIEIHSGRNRIVRRMFESLGYKVRKLDRVYFAGLTKKNLRRGAWRFLTEQEIAMLKMNSYN